MDLSRNTSAKEKSSTIISIFFYKWWHVPIKHTANGEVWHIKHPNSTHSTNIPMLMENDSWSLHTHMYRSLLLPLTLLLHFSPLETPGQPATLMLSVLGRKGPSSMTIGDVALVTVSGPETASNSTTLDMGNGDILVTVDAIPEGEFVVTLEGTDKVSNSKFQRQSTTQMSISKVKIMVCILPSCVYIQQANVFIQS